MYLHPLNTNYLNVSKTYVFYLLIIGVILRLPAIFFQELPPFQFCDEDIYSNEVFKMLTENRFFTQEFRSGGINIYPSYLLGKLFYLITGRLPELNELIILTRFFFSGILNASTLFILAKIGKITFKDALRPQIILLLGFICSPMVAGVSRIWYPDHYIIFFSSLFLYYLLLFIEHGKTKERWIFAKLGIALGLMVSAKYTGLLLAVPLIVGLFIDYRSKFKTKKIKEFIAIYLPDLTIMGIFTIAVLLLFQFSAIIYPDHFIEGFKFNLSNYNRSGPSFNFQGILFYFVILFISSLGIVGFALYLTGAFIFFKRQRSLFYIFLSFPLFIVIYLGKANLVINRNMIIAVPFILPLFANGLDFCLRIISKQNKHKKIFFTLLLAAMFLGDPVYKLIEQFTVDLKTDSRIIARQWIDENIPEKSIIIHNEFCSGESPAKAQKFSLKKDEGNLSDSFNYYIYNDWWDSSIKDFFSKKSLLLESKYSQLHYLHLNDKMPLSLNRQQDSFNNLKAEKKLEVVKEFSSSGPRIVILKKIN